MNHTGQKMRPRACIRLGGIYTEILVGNLKLSEGEASSEKVDE